MAFPSIASVVTTDNAASTSHAVNLPVSIAAGDRLIVAIGCVNTPTITPPAGFSQVISQLSAAGTFKVEIYEKIADGAEGATAAFGFSVSTACMALAHRITGAHGSTASAAAGVGAAAATTTDPPSLSPSWGAEDDLWLAYSLRNSTTVAPTGYPTNYGLSQTPLGSATQNRHFATAGRQLTAASEDPGVFTYAGSNANVGVTLAVRSAVRGFPFSPNPMLPLIVR